MRKITVEVPERDLEAAQVLTGLGVTETVRAGLKTLSSMRAQQELRKLRGTYQFATELTTLRDDGE